MDLKTRAIQRLTHNSETEAYARWSPDGTRIAFMRVLLDEKANSLCTIGTDGLNEVCTQDNHWQVGAVSGWLDDHRLVIRADSGRVISWFLWDVDRGERTPFQMPPGSSSPFLDPTGRWAIASTTSTERFVARIWPTDRPEQWRDIIAEDSTVWLNLNFSSRAPPADYLDSIFIERPAVVGAVRVPYLLRLRGRTKSHAPVAPGMVRWRSLTPGVGQIDSLGIFVATDTGRAVIEASAGGWRVVRDTLVIRPLPVQTVLRENWEAPDAWSLFGEPLPRIIEGPGHRRSFLNNGDGNFFSGAYLRRGLDPTHGLALDVDLATPITRTQWQVIIAVMFQVGDSSTLTKWDHRTGYLPSDIAGPRLSCVLAYPEGEAADAARHASPLGELAKATGNPRFRLDTGAWWHLRLQLFPDGRCGVAINGQPLLIDHEGFVSARPVRLLFEGSSVGSQVLVGPLRVVAGVPADIDWTTLRFNGREWRPRFAHN
jgi:hypothetical protein